MPELSYGMELWVSDTGRLVAVHAETRCSGHCAIHNPSSSHMSSWPRHWDDANHRMMRICEHGVKHTDFDQMLYFATVFDTTTAQHLSGHVPCDGCCLTDYIDGEVVQLEIES